MRIRHLLLGTAALCVASPALADSPKVQLDDTWALTVDGQYRPRVIAHTGRDFVSGSERRETISQRAALGFKLTQADGPSFYINLQDVRIWGEEDSASGPPSLNDFSSDGLDLREAYALFPIAERLSLKLGRQKVAFDTHRLIGTIGWRQSGQSFDGGRLTYSAKSFDMDLFYAKVREAGGHADGHVPAAPTPRTGGDIDLGVFHVTVPVSEALKIAPIYVLKYSDAAARDVRHTMGATISGKPGPIDYSAEGFYQLTKVAGEDGSTFLAALNAGYTADVMMSPSIGLRGEYVGGDGTPEGAFDTMYATNHKFYGEADYFLNIPGNTGRLGLMDLGGRAGFKPHKKLKFQVDVHHFKTVEDDANGDNTLGTEVDFKAIYAAREDTQLRLMYALFMADTAMGTLKGVEDPVNEGFVYLTLDYKF